MELLNKYWQDGKNFLNCNYAILGGAMSWVSEHNLVSAISNAGGFGVLACGSMSPELLDQEIKATKKLTKNSFGVNLIIMHPQLDELIKICKYNNVSHVVLAGGLPKTITIDALKEANIKIMCFAPALAIAKKLVRSGVDALIIEGMEAGGHIGPVTTFVLAQEIIPEINSIPIFVAGGIGRGEAIACLLQMGAAGCQLGTRFVCAKESIAHNNFKKSFIKANSRNATISIQLDNEFPVIPVRAIENQATKAFLNAQQEAINDFKNGIVTKEQAQLKIEHFWAGALRRAVIDGDVENGSIMAGQSVGLVNAEQTVEEIIHELIDQAEKSLVKNSQIMNNLNKSL